MKPKSCARGTKCRFSHKIGDEQRNDPAFIDKIRKEKDLKASKCINEFQEEGSCTRGLECPFSHKVSEEDRTNKELRQKMAEKRNIALGKTDGQVSLKNLESKSDQGLKGLLIKLMADVKELKERYP